MDIARGGQFLSIPTPYPDGAWYTYDDPSCDYACMVAEYTYWALTSMLGAQSFAGRLEEIQHEWRLNTREKVQQQDTAVYTLPTDSQYRLPTVLPDGHYDGATFTITSASAGSTGDNGNGSGSDDALGAGSDHEILQAVSHANPGYKIAFTDETHIYMMNPDGSDKEVLADGSPIAGYVAWSADAYHVYFASAKGPAESAWEAFRVDVQSKALTQFHTDLYIISLADAEAKWAAGARLELSDMRTLVSASPAEQFWFEELHWNPVKPADGGEPILAYTQTWRYDEDDFSYTHAYSIRADGSEKTLVAENKDQPIWDFSGDLLCFLDMSCYSVNDHAIRHITVNNVRGETATANISPDGGFVLFEVGDEPRCGGMARLNDDGSADGVIIGTHNIMEPRWSPVPVQ